MDRSALHALALLAAMCGPLSHAVAQQWTVFNMANAGFPSNTVTAVTQDGQGTVWAATDWGLCRFDGSDWTVIQQANSGLPDNLLRCLAVDADDRLWVGTTFGGIGILDGTEWTVIDMSNSPLADNEIAGITHDHRGWAWISTPTGLYCWTGADWRWYNDTPQSHDGFQLFGPNMAATAVRDDGLVTVATRNAGLTYITEEDFIYYTSSNSNFPDNSANGVALDAFGGRWLACPAGGLIWHPGPFVGGQWFQYNAFNTGLPDNTLTCIVIDEADRKIAGTETAGVLVFQGPGDWYMLDPANSGLPDLRVLSLMVDGEGNLWAGTMNGGLARYDGFTSIAASRSHPDGGLALYPNPSDGDVQVDLHGFTGVLQWTLVDVAGRQVAHGRALGGGNFTLVPERTLRGTYLLQVIGGDRSAAARVMFR